MSHLIHKISLAKNPQNANIPKLFFASDENLHFILIPAFENAFKLSCDLFYCVFYILPGVASSSTI